MRAFSTLIEKNTDKLYAIFEERKAAGIEGPCFSCTTQAFNWKTKEYETVSLTNAISVERRRGLVRLLFMFDKFIVSKNELPCTRYTVVLRISARCAIPAGHQCVQTRQKLKESRRNEWVRSASGCLSATLLTTFDRIVTW